MERNILERKDVESNSPTRKEMGGNCPKLKKLPLLRKIMVQHLVAKSNAPLIIIHFILDNMVGVI